LLHDTDRIHLTEPLDYITFVSLLRRCFLILTDSGGIQEEAPTFGKPVLVLRKLTERPEASQFGMAKIIGMGREAIVREASRLLTDTEAYQDMSEGANPYGDGHGSERIAEAIARWHEKKTPLLEQDKQFKLPPRPQPRRRKTDIEEAARKAAAAGCK
jgi:UDP-N-acetylglucosamine 2-epimerase (non-hydrolysing)